MTEVKNFIASYPNPNDPKLVVNISHLEEFAELQLDVGEDRPIAIGPLKHQLAQSRYFNVNTMNDRGLLYHEVGTGKSCSASIIVESFKKSLVDGKPRKPALILVRNSALREAFRHEISQVCTRDEYFSKLTDSELRELEKGETVELTEEKEKRRLNVSIGKTYEIVKYSDILDSGKKGKGLPSDEVIIRDYSNRIIIIDEIQNIRMQPNEKAKSRYSNLFHFLHTVENCTIIVMTGTPIWDKIYDIAGVFNLLLPLDEQFPTGKTFQNEYFDQDNVLYPEKGKEFLNKILGMVSYLRASTSSAVRTEVGISKPWLKHMIAYPSAMSEIQSKCEKEAREREGKPKRKKDKKSIFDIAPGDVEDFGGSFYADARDAANGIYPKIIDKGVISKTQGGYGVEYFKEIAVEEKHIKATNEDKTEISKVFIIFKFKDVNISNALRPADGADPFVNLRQYSCKLTTIIEMMIHPKRLNEKVFIYNDSVSGTGGCISMALILQLWKFRWIKNPESIPKEGRVIDVTSPGSFVLITSEDQTINLPTQIIKTLELFSADNNIYGNTLRIIVGSEAVSQGYTMKAIRQCHITQPHWNMSALDQAMGRVFRFGSHNQLPENERYLNIYRHIAVNKGKNWSLANEQQASLGAVPIGTFSDSPTVDTIIYNIAEKKEYQSFQLYRIMKIASWDCALNYKRNVLVNDIDNSRECDFQKCNYVCDGFDETNGLNKQNGPYFLKKNQGRLYTYTFNDVDTSNNNLLYSNDKVIEYMKSITDIFHNYFSLRYDMLKSLMGQGDIRDFILFEALDRLISYRVPIRDRYGFKAYLNEENDVYFLNKYITSKSDYLDSAYEVFPIINEISSLQNSIEIIQLNDDVKLVKNFVKNPSNESFQKLSHPSKIILLESSISEKGKLSGKQKEIIDIVLDAMKNDYFKMESGDIVHNLYNTEYTGIEYETSKKLEMNGKLRVFNRHSKLWSYVDNPTIEKKYISEIKGFVVIAKKSKNVLVGDNPYKIQGAYNNKNEFKIIDNRTGTSRIGTTCSSYKIPYLIDVIHHLGFLPPVDEEDLKNINYSKPEIISLLKEHKNIGSPYRAEMKDMSLTDLKKLYILSELNKEGICLAIEEFLKEKNLVIT